MNNIRDSYLKNETNGKRFHLFLEDSVSEGVLATDLPTLKGGEMLIEIATTDLSGLTLKIEGSKDTYSLTLPTVSGATSYLIKYEKGIFYLFPWSGSAISVTMTARLILVTNGESNPLLFIDDVLKSISLNNTTSTSATMRLYIN